MSKEYATSAFRVKLKSLGMSNKKTISTITAVRTLNPVTKF
jgi:hypothetical protein